MRVLLLMLPLLLLACSAEESRPQITSGTATAAATRFATPKRTATSTPTATPAIVATPRTPGAAATITSIVDGDTIDVALDGAQRRVRLILIDTPEVFGGGEQCYGRAASDFTKALLPTGTSVTLEKDVSETDRFGRLLRYVWLADGRMANELIVAQGYASLSTFPPDVKYQDRIRAAEREARNAGRGLWTVCASPTPAAAPAQPPAPIANCHPSYPDVCIPPPPPDLDCPQNPHRRFRVVGSDPHRFDADRDGIGCES